MLWPGGAFIFDPKGEHAERTFHIRKKYVDCYALDPSGAINKNAHIPLASFNPYDEIDVKNDNAGSVLREIIRASVYEEKNESANSKYFKDKAIEIALGYSVHLLTKYPKKYHNLPSMFDLFLMGSPDGVGVDENALKKLHAEMMVNEAVGSAAMIAAKTLKDAGEKGELGGIKNSFSTAFQWVKDEAIIRTLKSSSFSMKDIRKEDISLYVCVRLEHLKDEHYVRWFRTISTMALQATREQITSRYKTLFLFDEFYHLGTFEPVARGLTTLRGQNVKLHLFFQNIGQIKALYKNSADFLSSCDKQFFGVTENETAKEISEQLGKYIEKWPEGSEDHPRYNERERLLRPPSEILGQLAKGKTEQYIIPTNGFPMELELVPFYKNFDQYGEVYNKEITDG